MPGTTAVRVSNAASISSTDAMVQSDPRIQVCLSASATSTYGHAFSEDLDNVQNDAINHSDGRRPFDSHLLLRIG